MRNTKQKDLIYNVVKNSNSHYTAEDIYDVCSKVQPNISLGTVYRNLNLMVLQRKIRRIKMPDNIDRYDKVVKHSHAICNICGKVIDIFDDVVKKTPVIEGFCINNYDLIFNGICNECKEEEENGIKR